MIKLLLFSLTTILLFGCQATNNYEQSSDKEIIDMHTSRISLDWQGTYSGILPTAGAGGVETIITINEDYSYTMRTKYISKENNFQIRKGEFEWDENGGKIILQNLQSAPAQYLVGENKLIQLDMDGNRITGELEEHYILRKAD